MPLIDIYLLRKEFSQFRVFIKKPKELFSVDITIGYKGVQIQDFLVEVVPKIIRLLDSLLLTNVSNRLKSQESKAPLLDFLDFLSLYKVHCD
jgi:hypothetical protein